MARPASRVVRPGWRPGERQGRTGDHGSAGVAHGGEERTASPHAGSTAPFVSTFGGLALRIGGQGVWSGRRSRACSPEWAGTVPQDCSRCGGREASRSLRTKGHRSSTGCRAKPRSWEPWSGSSRSPRSARHCLPSRRTRTSCARDEPDRVNRRRQPYSPDGPGGGLPGRGLQPPSVCDCG